MLRNTRTNLLLRILRGRGEWGPGSTEDSEPGWAPFPVLSLGLRACRRQARGTVRLVLPEFFFYYFCTDVTSGHTIKKYTYRGPAGL